MSQTRAFLVGEGKAWLERNRDKLPVESDPVTEAMLDLKLHTSGLLEIGCANGWRLHKLDQHFPYALLFGLDPGLDNESVKVGHAYLRRGVASHLPYIDNAFDTVIYGFCLYLCDRVDLFQIAREGDRVLADGGHLIIHDFHPDSACKCPYHHLDGLFSYKMDYAALWLANPAYSLVRQDVFSHEGAVEAVSVLKKDMQKGWPLDE